VGVGRFVPSQFGADLEQLEEGVNVVFDKKKRNLKRVQESGVDYTVVYTNVFMEYLFAPFFFFDVKNRKAAVFQDDQHVYGAIHTDDIARLVPEILLNPNSKNATLRLAADFFKWGDAISAFEKKVGHKFEVRLIRLQEVEETIKKQDVNVYEQLVAVLVQNYIKREGAAFFDADNLRDPFYKNVRLTKLQDYVGSYKVESTPL